MIEAYPKIFTFGSKPVINILAEEHIIQEKIDGSFFAFGVIDGVLQARSKGKMLDMDSPEKMFQKGVDYIKSIQDKIPENYVFYCEFLNKPKHNTLEYSRVPENNLVLFGYLDPSAGFVFSELSIEYMSGWLGVEPVRYFYNKIRTKEDLDKLLDQNSQLGGVKIEGVVIKNYKPLLLGNVYIPVTGAKYVSERFKEVHNKNWKQENTGKGKWEQFKESYRTDARWQKAIQHLRESGKLEGSPRDISLLIKEVKQDIMDEERENILSFLFKTFGDELLRESVKGLPEWYKEKLVEESFNG